MRNLVSFTISVFLHVALGTVLVLWSFLQNSEHRPVKAVLVELELKRSNTDREPLAKIKVLKNSSKGGRAFSARESQNIAKKLLQRYSFEEGVGQNNELNFETFGDDTTSIFGENDNWGYHQEVYTRIDSHLMFDSLLAQYGHFGSVFIEFTVSDRGYLLDEGLRVGADDAILKVHVMRALRAALKKEFDPADWSADGQKVRFQARFKFIQEPRHTNFVKQKTFGKPALSFVRATLEKPIPTNLKEHLMNGGVGIDPFAVTERWQKYNKRKSLKAGKFDPFANYKKDPDYFL